MGSFCKISHLISTIFLAVFCQDAGSSRLLPHIIINTGSGEMKHSTEQSKITNEVLLNVEDFPVKLSCSANIPVEWSIRGHDIQTNDSLIVRRTDHDLENGEIEFTSTITLQSGTKSVVGFYYCQNSTNSENFKSIYLFINSEKPEFLSGGKSLTVQPNVHDEVTLPCSVTTPGVNPDQEFYVNDYAGWSPRRLKLEFDPKRGFIMEEVQPGKYRCLTETMGETDATNYVDVEVKSPVDFFVKPKTDHFYVNSGFELRCSGVSDVFLKFGDNVLRNVDIVYSYRPSHFYPYSAVLKYSQVEPGDKGEISCSRENNRIIHSWNFEHTDFKIGLNINSEMNALTCCGVDSAHMSFLTCTNPEECLARKPCFLDGNSGPDVHTRLKSERSNPTCKSLELNKFGGHLVNCTRDSVTEIQMYFLGLVGKIYKHSETSESSKITPETAVIALKINDNSEAVCTWIPFQLSENILWTLKFVNSSVEIYRTGVSMDGGKFKASSHLDGRMESILKIEKMDDLSSISCSSRYWAGNGEERANALLILRSVSEGPSESSSSNQLTAEDLQLECLNAMSIFDLFQNIINRHSFLLSQLLAILVLLGVVLFYRNIPRRQNNYIISESENNLDTIPIDQDNFSPTSNSSSRVITRNRNVAEINEGSTEMCNGMVLPVRRSRPRSRRR